MTRVLPAWVGLTVYLLTATLAGVAVGITIAPIPDPLVIIGCPAPVFA